jgi:hypothetical protein
MRVNQHLIDAIASGAPAYRLGGFDTSRPLGFPAFGILYLHAARQTYMHSSLPSSASHLFDRISRSVAGPRGRCPQPTGALGSYNSGILFFSVELRKAEVKACAWAVVGGSP